MKRILVIGLSMIITIGMMGCSSKKEGKTNEVNNNGTELVEEQLQSPEVMFFGKVKKVVGNEIEVELAKDPNMGGETIVNEGEFETEVGDAGDSAVGSITMSDSAVVGEAVETTEEGEVFELMQSEGEKLELEYINETKTFTIPTGTKVFDLRFGKEENFTALKSGTVIRIYASGTEDSPVVLNVDIVE